MIARRFYNQVMENFRVCAARRWIYGAFIFFIPLLGLGIRADSIRLHPFLATYAPDVLWAWLVFALVVTFAPRLSTPRAGGVAFTFALAMECSQLYQAPWLNAWRTTFVGGLLLGYGFLWSDLLCYAAGILFAISIDFAVRACLPHSHFRKP